jgi:hypothetical protein
MSQNCNQVILFCEYMRHCSLRSLVARRTFNGRASHFLRYCSKNVMHVRKIPFATSERSEQCRMYFLTHVPIENKIEPSLLNFSHIRP